MHPTALQLLELSSHPRFLETTYSSEFECGRGINRKNNNWEACARHYYKHKEDVDWEEGNLRGESLGDSKNRRKIEKRESESGSAMNRWNELTHHRIRPGIGLAYRPLLILLLGFSQFWNQMQRECRDYLANMMLRCNEDLCL